MSVPQNVKCVFCTFTRSTKPPRAVRRNFSSTPSQSARRKPQFPSVKADLRKATYVKKEELEKHFTPEQRASITAANKVIDRKNIQETKGNAQPWSLKYYDDLSQIDPVVDKPVKAPWKNIDENSRLKTDAELNDDLYKLMNNLPDDEVEAAEVWRKFDENMRLTIGKEEAERNPRSALAPELPKLDMGDKPKAKKQQQQDSNDRDSVEPSPGLLRLMQSTGMDRRQIAGLRVKTIISHRVVNQTRLGKIQKQYMLSVAGNGNGLIGIGEGKSDEQEEARLQSQYRAIRNMQPILRYENRTIFGDVSGKVSATELELYARPPGESPGTSSLNELKY